MAVVVPVSSCLLHIPRAAPVAAAHKESIAQPRNSTSLRWASYRLELQWREPRIYENMNIYWSLAGNIAKDDPTANYPKPEDLVTPTLKSNTYTTGRGGQGNMALNDPERPEVARAAQDVEAHPTQSEPTHYGRGGAANILEKNGQRKASVEAKRKSEEAKRQEPGKGGLLAKGKDLLNKLKK
jgi:hypothetical protein